MASGVRHFFVLSLLFLHSALFYSQSQNPATRTEPPDQSSIKIKTQEVLLDVIVKDKKGRPIRDLKPEEIEVFEDGVKQPIADFSVIGFAASETGKKTEAAAVTAPSRQFNLITIVFDHLTAQRVQPVKDAALNFVDNALTEDMLVRVVVIGKRLYVIEQFTNDRAKLRKAVTAATGTVEKSFAEISSRITGELKTLVGDRAAVSAESNPILTEDNKEILLAKVTLDSLSASEKLSKETKSNLHVFSLIPFARAHQQVFGRKMALYFSDGLYMPSGMGEVLKAVVSESNRANLSFYAVNIRNLLAGAGNQVSRLETSTVVNQSRRPDSGAFNSGNADSFSVSDRYEGRTQIRTNFNMFEAMDRSRELNKKGALADLTEGTGGQQITNINDVNGALRRIAAELGQYYVLSYQPTNQSTDGKFRAINVKISRSGAKAQTRNGYFALSTSKSTRPVMSFETPMLAAIENAIVPHDFPFQTGMMHFESNQNKSHYAVLLNLPLGNFIHQEDKEKKSYTLQFAVLGILKNEKGEILERFSEPHQFEVPAAMIDSIRKSELSLSRHFWLAPGQYTLETVAHDQSDQRISAERKAFTIAPPREQQSVSKLQTGALFLVKQIDPVDELEAADPENPLIIQGKRLTPELERNLSTDGRQDLSFHLPIYINLNSTEKPSLKLELFQEGKLKATTSAELPKPDEKGWIGFTAGVPASSLKPGAYRFHAIVIQGSEKSEESVDFSILGERKNEPEAPEEKGITSALNAVDKVGELTLTALKSFQPIELSIQTLLHDVEKSGVDMYPKLGDYTYSLRKVRRTLTPKGKIKSEDYQDFEAYPVKGRHALIQLSENGSQLAIGRIDLNRRSATETLIKNESERVQPAGAAEATLNTGYWSASVDGAVQRKGQPRRIISINLDPESFFQFCEFSSPRSLLLDGRETIVLDFKPRADARVEPDKDWIRKLKGTIWIDAVEKTLVRIEGQNATAPAASTETALPNFVYQQQRLAAGVWGPSLIRINAGGDEDLFNGLNWDAWFEFTKYKRFDTQDMNQKILSPEDKK